MTTHTAAGMLCQYAQLERASAGYGAERHQANISWAVENPGCDLRRSFTVA